MSLTSYRTAPPRAPKCLNKMPKFGVQASPFLDKMQLLAICLEAVSQLRKYSLAELNAHSYFSMLLVAPIAQLDRASDYGSEGFRFNS